MQQYFTYKRIQGESVSAYLVRETLFFEEFLESLMDLKDGPSMDFIFDKLDPNTDEEDDDEEDDDEEDEHRGSSGVELLALVHVSRSRFLPRRGC